jgi:hypothetical protein
MEMPLYREIVNERPPLMPVHGEDVEDLTYR